MGIFAFYNGLIYNECFAIPLDIFGSCYSAVPFYSVGINSSARYNRTSFDCVYPIGVDPVWALSTNYLTFTNNMKMKIAVILGVS